MPSAHLALPAGLAGLVVGLLLGDAGLVGSGPVAPLVCVGAGLALAAGATTRIGGGRVAVVVTLLLG
ncbi:MAG: hypothetical protein M3295_00270, partial [Chloroflexota bacterium]|nr:hypothetical protein [Chloroflexota bacterium]